MAAADRNYELMAAKLDDPNSGTAPRDLRIYRTEDIDFVHGIEDLDADNAASRPQSKGNSSGRNTGPDRKLLSRATICHILEPSSASLLEDTRREPCLHIYLARAGEYSPRLNAVPY
jgi:hypothetical protein